MSVTAERDVVAARTTAWPAVLVVTSAAGVLLLAISFAGARVDRSWAGPLLWVALSTIYVPIVLRLLGQRASARERLLLVVIGGMSLYAVKVLSSPLLFNYHDEHGFFRQTTDLIAGGRLYTDNPLVGAYAFYPGLPAVTAALSQTSGLGIFPAGLIVIGAARLLVMVGIFMIVTSVTRSAWIAGLTAMFYAGNPNFVYFDAQFGYESLALGLLAAALWAATYVGRQDSGVSRGAVGLVLLLGAGTVITHHLASYALTLALLTWAALASVSRSHRDRWPGLAVVALATLLGVVGWRIFAGPATDTSIGPSITGAVDGVRNIVTGQGAGRAPFSGGTMPTPILEELVGIGSVLVALASLPAGLWFAAKARRRHPLIPLLALVALSYPATLALRLTAAGAETSNRTSEYVFLGLATLAALAVVAALTRLGTRPRARAGVSLAVAALALVAFLGGITVGWPPYDRLPGGYLVSGGPRSMDPHSVRAARWAGRNLVPDSRMVTDVSNGSLMIAFGDQSPQGGEIDGVKVGTLFFRPTFTPVDAKIIVDDRLRYIVVDRRLSTQIPRSQRYFDSGDPMEDAYTRPLPAAALAKFDTVDGINRIYDDGTIRIYDASALIRSQTGGTLR